jgi:D-glycero-alpha-D-manno-heptose-7-phosphate kinase
MIITKTPYRISFFGGGSDYPEWFDKFDGEVISTTINKYIYITCRELPHFFKHKYRIVYSKIENVKDIKNIQHNAVKTILNYSKINKGLEIHYDGDLPSRSGMGSSSSFVVGLLKAISAYNKKNLSKIDLAKKSIFLERSLMRENVGYQDQIAAAFGGFNLIKFNKKCFEVKKIITENSFEKKLNENLFLLYTGINRTAQKVAKTYTGKLQTANKENIREILNHVNEAKKIIKKNLPDEFGLLLNDTWIQKRQMSKLVSSEKIDFFYKNAIKNGALGGKLLGAGGGGFLLFYVPKKNHQKFNTFFSKHIILPIKLTKQGSEIIFNENYKKI